MKFLRCDEEAFRPLRILNTATINAEHIHLHVYSERSHLRGDTLHIDDDSLAILAIPSPLLNAALPIGARRNVDPFSDSLRIGLAPATLIIVAVVAGAKSASSSSKPGAHRWGKCVEKPTTILNTASSSNRYGNKTKQRKEDKHARSDGRTTTIPTSSVNDTTNKALQNRRSSPSIPHSKHHTIRHRPLNYEQEPSQHTSSKLKPIYHP